MPLPLAPPLAGAALPAASFAGAALAGAPFAPALLRVGAGSRSRARQHTRESDGAPARRGGRTDQPRARASRPCSRLGPATAIAPPRQSPRPALARADTPPARPATPCAAGRAHPLAAGLSFPAAALSAAGALAAAAAGASAKTSSRAKHTRAHSTVAGHAVRQHTHTHTHPVPAAADARSRLRPAGPHGERAQRHNTSATRHGLARPSARTRAPPRRPATHSCRASSQALARESRGEECSSAGRCGRAGAALQLPVRWLSRSPNPPPPPPRARGPSTAWTTSPFFSLPVPAVPALVGPSLLVSQAVHVFLPRAIRITILLRLRQVWRCVLLLY